MVNLYRIIKGKLRFVHRGLASRTDSYIAQGFIVINPFFDLDVAGQIKRQLKLEQVA